MKEKEESGPPNPQNQPPCFKEQNKQALSPTFALCQLFSFSHMYIYGSRRE